VKHRISIVLAGLVSFSSAAAADEAASPRRDATFLVGTLQPVVLSGWNVEFDARWGRLVAGYSHGWLLEIPVTGALKDQALSVHSPYSTGFGIGYEVLDGLSLLRLEPKIHRFEIDYDDRAARSAMPVAEYRTITLGLGAYYVGGRFERSTIGLADSRLRLAFAIGRACGAT